MTTAVVNDSEKIECAICGAKVHSIQLHLNTDHSEVAVDDYMAQFPGFPLLSPLAQKKLDEKLAAKAAGSPATVNMAGMTSASVSTLIPRDGMVKQTFADVFDLGKAPAAKNARGGDIAISVNGNPGDKDLVPEVDDAYIFDIEILKNVILGLESNMPVYAYGHTGTGKSSLFEQIAARTSRPFMRVQHTINTEESHVLGQWIAKGGETVFELGPLPMAMQNGWMYMADEYDFSLPSVLSVYQPVLEGKPLVIKEADLKNRVIHPHPNFRFVATGNTNGTGDETGLYQGTNIQNEANYDRFGVCVEILYMKPAMESRALVNHVQIAKEDADKLVDFATKVREAYGANKISKPIGPRALINAAQLGKMRANWSIGLNLAFINKMTQVDRETARGLAQRIFG